MVSPARHLRNNPCASLDDAYWSDGDNDSTSSAPLTTQPIAGMCAIFTDPPADHHDSTDSDFDTATAASIDIESYIEHRTSNIIDHCFSTQRQMTTR